MGEQKKTGRFVQRSLAGLILILFVLPPTGHAGPDSPADAKSPETVVKELPVAVSATGNPAFGYRVKEKRAAPAAVKVAGPEKTLARMERVHTHSIDITGSTETIKQEAALDLPEGIRCVQNNPKVSATIVIEKQLVEKTFENVPIQMLHAVFPSTIQPDTVAVTLRTSVLEISDSFSKADIEAYIDLKGLGPGIY
ncbi:MAG: YbbR-like domain-containing protein, partial [Desulfosalsimonas sp.]